MHERDLRMAVVWELVDGRRVELQMTERELARFKGEAGPLWLRVEGFDGHLDDLDNVEVQRIVAGESRVVYERADLEGMLADVEIDDV